MQTTQTDVVIIGAGLAGLSAGITLVQAGYSVKIVEKHNRVGGCATTFPRKNFEMEVGLHAINGLREGELPRQLICSLGIWEHLRPLEIPELYHFQIPGVLSIDFPTNSYAALANFKELFPNEASVIDRYFKDLETGHRFGRMISGYDSSQREQMPEILADEFDTLKYWQTTSVGAYLDRLKASHELQACILGNLGYYSDNPYRLSLLYFLMAQSSFLYGGAFYLQGGSQSLSNALKNEFIRLGGEIDLRTEVSSLIFDGDRVAGCTSETSKNYRCNYLIANCAIPYLIGQLLPDRFKRKFNAITRKHEPSCSLSNLYLGFEGNLTDLGSKYYSNFFLAPEALKNFDSLRLLAQNSQSSISQLEWHKYSGCFINYGLVNHGLFPENLNPGVICSIDYANRWNLSNKLDYKKQKKEFETIMLSWLDKIHPGATNRVFYKEVSTPLTIQRYTNNSAGSPYGYEQSIGASGSNRIGFVSPIKGLFFASAWTRPGGGFTGALMSGRLCASKVSRLLARKSKQAAKS